MRRNLNINEASDVTGVSKRNIRRAIDDGVLQCSQTPTGQLRFSLDDLEAISPGLVRRNATASRDFIRPQRIVTAHLNETKGKIVQYLRDPKEALALGAGLDLEARGALSLLIDLMMVHDQQGIPAYPPSYIAGMLGVGQVKWSKTLRKKLLATQKIKLTRRNGIDVYVLNGFEGVVGERSVSAPSMFQRGTPQGFATAGAEDRYCRDVEAGVYDEDLTREDLEDLAKDGGGLAKTMLRDQEGDRAPGGINREPLPYWKHGAAEPVETPPDLKKFDGGAYSGHTDTALPPHPTQKLVADMTEADKAKVMAMAEGPAACTTRAPESAPEPAACTTRPAPEYVPAPSAIDVLRRAGVDVAGHPAGEWFWARIEHGETLSEWLKVAPLNEIVANLARARQDGRLPEHPNRLGAYTPFIRGGKR